MTNEIILLVFVAAVIAFTAYKIGRKVSEEKEYQPKEVVAEHESLVYGGDGRVIDYVQSGHRYNLRHYETLERIDRDGLSYEGRLFSFAGKGSAKKRKVYLDYCIYPPIPEKGLHDDILCAARRVDITEKGSKDFFDGRLLEIIEKAMNGMVIDLDDWESQKKEIEDKVKKRLAEEIFNEARMYDEPRFWINRIAVVG